MVGWGGCDGLVSNTLSLSMSVTSTHPSMVSHSPVLFNSIFHLLILNLFDLLVVVFQTTKNTPSDPHLLHPPLPRMPLHMLHLPLILRNPKNLFPERYMRLSFLSKYYFDICTYSTKTVSLDLFRVCFSLVLKGFPRNTGNQKFVV